MTITRFQLQNQPGNGLTFNCSEGCGPCGVKFVRHEHYRHEDEDGKVIESRTTPKLVSTCCGNAVEVWDEQADDVVGAVDVTPMPVRLTEAVWSPTNTSSEAIAWRCRSAATT